MTPGRQVHWWKGLLPDLDTTPQPEDVRETPIVEWKPIRCPYCGSGLKFTYGKSRHKPVRYHLCRSCGSKFRSIES